MTAINPEIPSKYIGEKKVSTITDSDIKTPGGNAVMLVEYEGGTKEYFSSLMLDKIISETACDATALREKRLYPIVEQVLGVLAEWGIKLSELGYMSVLLNQSIDFNQKEALIKLWSLWGTKLLAPDDIDMITIDRVLKTQTIDDIINADK